MRIKRIVRLKVKELAEQQKLYLSDLVAGSGLDARVIRRMIKNERVHQMQVSQLARIAEALGVPTNALMEDEDRE